MNFSDQRSIYMQIADHICESILTGAMAPGERIASVREMAVAIEVNPNTVQRSYTWLLEKEILTNKRGIGFFIADDAYLKVKLMKRDKFIREELPGVFRTMSLVGFDFDDLKTIYTRHNEQI